MAAKNGTSSLDRLSDMTERAIVSVGDSIANNLSNGYDNMIKSTEAIVFPRHAEEQEREKKAAWNEEQQRQMHLEAAMDKAEQDYKAASKMAKKALREEREMMKKKNVKKPLALPSFRQKKSSQQMEQKQPQQQPKAQSETVKFKPAKEKKSKLPRLKIFNR
mmetsp:Transcript_1754/g.3759  ORF Transcript_1754/g.3759 Transcript_1754/m.3759 type:complete len:162 (-) Transcript_1754:102-587(-)|eukprot:CAMPEP_0172312594 /NCGR_PEP_ID=MMETSP1058-20130122/18056_1 /TAXON_ID=83371 /ORGANISM="Detonula confervacea, Strain CCMP 353" /LENGTH=161 /DNA_ID=CAMNT_0013026103 /DNA_START=255 /DNA_END=740 /DNA_ORIENTATION=+